jgi:ribosome-associated protein
MDETPGHLRLAPGVSVPTAALSWTQVRSGGPGGQNVNQTASKVELRLPQAAIVGLSPAAHARLASLAGARLVGDQLLLTCDETRSARQNRELLHERLCALVEAAKAVPRARKKTRPSRGSVHRRLEDKAKRSEVKRERRKT